MNVVACILQNSFTALKVPCVPLTYPFLPSSPWQPLIFLFYIFLAISIVLSFLECLTAGFIIVNNELSFKIGFFTY